MANIRIKLSSDKRINNVNRYSDVDVASENVSRTLYDRSAIRNSIYNILKWKPYERILDPAFGNSLWNNVFDMVSRYSKSDVVKQVNKMLAYEPRISVQDIDVSVDPEGHSVNVSFSYTIPALDGTVENYSMTISRG